MSDRDRSLAIRALARLGRERLRALRRGAPATLLRRIESGVVTVPSGRGQGLRFQLRHLPIDHAHFGSITHGLLEVPVQEALARHLAPGGVLYDVGANVGFFSLLGARLAGPDGHVYAFEPVAESADAIAEHAALNGIDNVTVIAKAVSSRAGRANLQLVDDRSWSKLEDYGEHPGAERTVEVDTVAIDGLGIDPPTIVKVDVEGAELAVLEGMSATIERHKPAVVCELHGTHAGFVAAMAAHGYRVIDLDRALPVAEDSRCEHALALPALDPGD